jgi:hypothetical protein
MSSNKIKNKNMKYLKKFNEATTTEVVDKLKK